MRSSAHSHLLQKQTSSTQRNDFYHADISTDEEHCLRPITEPDQNWDPDSPRQHFSTLGHAMEKATPMQLGHDSAATTSSKSRSSASMTGRASTSAVSDQNTFGHHKISTVSSKMWPSSTQQHQSQGSDKASECDVRTQKSVSDECSISSSSFAQPTISSRKRTEKVNHPTPKPKEWTPSFTTPKSPRLRCVGKVSTFASTKDRGKTAKSNSKESSNHSETTCPSSKLPIPCKPETPNVLRRKTFFSRKSTAQEEPNRTFVPNPIPNYLRNGNLPEIKQTRKSLQLKESRMNPGRRSRDEGPSKVVPRVSLDPTAVKPFALGSVVKHEERINQIQRRLVAEEEDDRKRREFHPVALQPEILRGPTFVPRRSDIPLTRPVDLLPHAQDRSERTRAFEARQHRRMEEMDRSKHVAAEEREKHEEEKLRMEYESKRFKSRPVPNSHYKPDITPVGVENKTAVEGAVLKSSPPHDEGLQPVTDTSYKIGAEETKNMYEEVADSMYNAETPSRSESKAATILEGLRKSLSPLLGRTSTSLS